ncbi:MAG TPA: SUMF1/EgtB/PvdO family nonheme iron enzyme [Xanthomonadales bacterium]|nr:SUMF1/EgtB/PvdO family nonheme iron enzyme [Xanthomonadales bacterium]
MNFNFRNRSAIGSALGVLLLAAAFAWRWLGPHADVDGTSDGAAPAVPRIVGLGTPRPGPAASPIASPAGTPEAATQETPTPTPAEPSLADVSAEVQADVDDALARADAAIAAQHILAPPEDNAIYWFDAALEIDPGNRAARAGRTRVIDAVVAQAAQAIDAGDADAAKALLDPLAAAAPGEESVKAATKRLETLPRAQTLLREAAQRMAAGERFEPRGASALDAYLVVRTIDPENSTAARGLAEIEQAMLSRALAAASEDDYAGADALLARTAEFLPGSQAQLETRTRILALRNDRFQGLVSRATAALDARNVELANELANRAAEIGADADAVQALRLRIANARLYDHYEPGEVFADAFASRDGSGPQLVVVPVGEFDMGSSARERGHRRDEEPPHRVALTKPFAVARSEVSVADFRRFVARTRYVTDAERLGSSSYYDEPKGRMAVGNGMDWRKNYMGETARDDDPVVHVSWNDAHAYLQWLSQHTGKHYRLPSEAEFEYAVRAGSTTRYPWGDGNPEKPLDNFTGEGDRSPSKRSWSQAFPRYSDGFWGPAPVRSFPANAFGLFDVDGNVSEWVEDCWHDNYVRAPRESNAWVNPGCERHVVRGGSWGSDPLQVRSAFRIAAPAETRSARVGFRIARDL